MIRRIATTDQLLREARWDVVKLALLGAAIIAAGAMLAVAAHYLPDGFPLRAEVVSSSEWLAVAVPTVLYVSCLTAICGVAHSSGQFLWAKWGMAAVATAVWPFFCLMAAMLVLGGVGALDLSPQMQRMFQLAAILPAIQLLCWSVAAGIGRLL